MLNKLKFGIDKFRRNNVMWWCKVHG